ncbi:palindromic element RPE4 domain-containing protein [Candidatus Rickettsia tasmanensis]
MDCHHAPCSCGFVAWLTATSVIPQVCSRTQLKNTNIVSIFSYFLDTVVKPRYDTEHVF